MYDARGAAIALGADRGPIANTRWRLELASLNLRLTEETLEAEKVCQSVGRAIQKDAP